MDKVAEEKRLKAQLSLQENQVKTLQDDLDGLNQQLKDKEHEHRGNEVKIKELRRQLPAKVLKPLDQKYHKLTNPARNSQPHLPP